MKKAGLLLLFAAFAAFAVPAGCDRGTTDLSPEELEALARCLTEKGWVMYGKVGCSGCITQRKSFGDAWHLINTVECDPHEPGNEAPRCVERKIRRTPTWILEVDGKEIKRIEEYQLLEYLARESGCDYPGSE